MDLTLVVWVALGIGVGWLVFVSSKKAIPKRGPRIIVPITADTDGEPSASAKTKTPSVKVSTQQKFWKKTRFWGALIFVALCIGGIYYLYSPVSESMKQVAWTTAKGFLVGGVVILIALFAPKDPFKWLKPILMLVGFLIIVATFMNSGFFTGAEQNVARAESCAANPNTIECAAPVTSRCPQTVTEIQPGETAYFQVEEGCINPNWRRETNDAVLFAEFNGSKGQKKFFWPTGGEQKYEGVPYSSYLTNMGTRAVTIIFSYN